MATPVVATRDAGRGTAPRGGDLDAKRRTYRRFVRGAFLFAAHIMVILALLALFRG